MAFKTAREDYGHINPVVFVNDGQRPNIQTKIAPYLPLEQYIVKTREYSVVMPGKPVALDNYGFIVPAGLRIEMGLAPGAQTLVYDAIDVANGVVNPDGSGNVVVAGDKVGTLLNRAGIHISRHIGVAEYMFYRNSQDACIVPGKNADVMVDNPTRLRHTNNETQSRIAIYADQTLQVPIVREYDPNWEGITVLEDPGAALMPGDLVGFNVRSNYCITSNLSNAFINDIVAQVYRINRFPVAGLDMVKTKWPASAGRSVLDRMPGTATGGLPDAMTYANTTVGTVYLNLILR